MTTLKLLVLLSVSSINLCSIFTLQEQYTQEIHLLFCTSVSSNLKGTIPSELSELSKLEVLDLSDNDIRGTIPNNLSAMEYMSK